MGTAFLTIRQVGVRLDVKEITDSGSGEILPAEATTGVVVNFTKTFLDIKSLNGQANLRYSGGIAVPLIAIIDFSDPPNPLNFRIYLYNTDTGQFDYGTFSWIAKGI